MFKLVLCKGLLLDTLLTLFSCIHFRSLALSHYDVTGSAVINLIEFTKMIGVTIILMEPISKP